MSPVVSHMAKLHSFIFIRELILKTHITKIHLCQIYPFKREHYIVRILQKQHKCFQNGN